MGQGMTADVVQVHKILSNAVVEAVKSWRFEPKMVNGRSVLGTYTLPFTFKLKSSKD